MHYNHLNGERSTVCDLFKQRLVVLQCDTCIRKPFNVLSRFLGFSSISENTTNSDFAPTAPVNKITYNNSNSVCSD